MASCRQRISEGDARRDVISELPAGVKEKILECLTIRDAARTALLSTHWNEVWLSHGQLVFDKEFLECLSKYEGEKGIALSNTINDILMLRAGPVQKFTLHISDPEPQQSDLDRWCLFLSRNGIQELNLSITLSGLVKHKLPSCIFSCPTIKKLILGGDLIFYFPIPAISHSLTSLAFKGVEFSDNFKGIGYNIPNLEELSFRCCKGITNFEISCSKLERYTVICSLFWSKLDESRWFTDYLKTIKTLCLTPSLFPCKNAEIATMTFPTLINLQVIEVCEFNVTCGADLAFVLQLLQNSPNLCLLNIALLSYECDCDITTSTSLLEDPNSCIIKQDMKTLNTIMIEGLGRSTHELLLVKMLLSKSPALERVIIMEYAGTDTSADVNSLKKLLRFPQASPKAQIVYLENFGLFDNIWFELCRNLE